MFLGSENLSKIKAKLMKEVNHITLKISPNLEQKG